MRKPGKTGKGFLVHPNIMRVDYQRTHGFYVRFYRTDASGVKQVTTKSFGDIGHGGRTRAFIAALAWRNATEKRLPGQKKRTVRPGEAFGPGYSYVKRAIKIDYRKGVRHETPVYVGFLRVDGRKHVMTRWSIPKWGDAVARQGCQDWLAHQKTKLETRLRRARRKKRGKKR